MKVSSLSSIYGHLNRFSFPAVQVLHPYFAISSSLPLDNITNAVSAIKIGSHVRLNLELGLGIWCFHPLLCRSLTFLFGLCVQCCFRGDEQFMFIPVFVARNVSSLPETASLCCMSLSSFKKGSSYLKTVQ